MFKKIYSGTRAAALSHWKKPFKVIQDSHQDVFYWKHCWHAPQGRRPKARTHWRDDILYLIWPEFPQEALLEKMASGLPCWTCCHHDLLLLKWQKMDGSNRRVVGKNRPGQATHLVVFKYYIISAQNRYPVFLNTVLHLFYSHVDSFYMRNIKRSDHPWLIQLCTVM